MYRRTREQIDGHPCFASAAGLHLFRHPEDEWHLSPKPFDPATTACAAWIAAAGGPVPTGARPWWVAVADGVGGKFVEAEVTAREVA
jgi:hypothetical protein